MANSVDTFKLYVQSLDSSTQGPQKPARSEPISVGVPNSNDDDAAFDTSYVDKVIFKTGGEDISPVASINEEVEVFALDPAFASFKSDVSVDVSAIDSGLQSPNDNVVGSYRSGRPDFLKLSSFMIWNDPDAKSINGVGTASTSVSPSASTNQLNPNSNQDSQNNQNLGVPRSTKTTFGQLAVSPTESPLSSPEPPNSGSKSGNMRRRGLFSWTNNAQLSNSGGHSSSEPTQLEVNLEVKSPKSPTSNGVGSGSVVSLNGPSATSPQEEEDRFNGEGVQFHGKLIGSEYVAEARGEQMCQQSLKKLKIIQKAMGGHKRRIHLYISFEGIKIADAMSAEQLFHHTVPQISFISRDETDTRAFGYVFGNSTTGHQFIGIKTKKEAMVIMTTIGQLFSITLKRKRSAEEAAALAIAESIKEDYKEYYKGSGAGAAGTSGSAEEHIYHSMYEGDSTLGKLGTSTSARTRSRTTSQNSAEVIIPALLPPPSSADVSAGGHLHHHHHHHSQQANSRPRGQSSTSSVSASLGGAAVVKLAPPPTSGSNLNSSSSEVPVFSSYMPYMPSGSAVIGGSANSIANNNNTVEWANFDDDVHGNFGNPNSQSAANNSVIDDSTLNTISSLSSEVNLGLGGLGSSILSSSRTLSQNADEGDLTTSATLVGPRSGQTGNNNLGPKNAARNGSSSTIASGTFDGADPFSDAFGTDDPFSGSMAVGGGSSGMADLTASQGGSLGNVKSHDALSSQFAGMNLERSTANLSGSFNLSKSVDSTSSADRYAALADIHNLSNSIFDSFGNKKSDLAAARKSEAPTTKSGNNLFASSQSVAIPGATSAANQANLFASQGGQFTHAFQQQQQAPQIPTGSHHSAMYGQPMSVYGGQVPSNGAAFITTTAGLVPGFTSQFSYNPAQSMATSTTSLPNAYGQQQQQFQQAQQFDQFGGQNYQQQQNIQMQNQQQFMPGNSPGYVMVGPATTMNSQNFSGQNPGQMMMMRNSGLQMQQGSSTSSLFATPPSVMSTAGAGQNVGSQGSINSMPLFEDLDILGKKKTTTSGFGMKSEPMFQQQSLDSFTRNSPTPPSTNQTRKSNSSSPQPNNSSNSTSYTPEPSFPPPSPSPLAVASMGVACSGLGRSSTSSEANSEVHSSQRDQWTSKENHVITSSNASTMVTNTVTTTTITTTFSTTTPATLSSVSSSSTSKSSEAFQSTIENCQTTGKFETTFDDVFEPSKASENNVVNKQESCEQKLLSEDQEEEEVENKKEVSLKEEVTQRRSSLAQEDQEVKYKGDITTSSNWKPNSRGTMLKAKTASTTSYDSLASETIKSIDLVPSSSTNNPVNTRKPTLSRQSSTSSSCTRGHSGTPPAIPPRTDLISSSVKPRPSAPPAVENGNSSNTTPPPPLPPPNKAFQQPPPSSASGSPLAYPYGGSSASSSPYYPPPYGVATAAGYGPYGPPPLEAPYGDPSRRHSYGRYPAPPNPWAHHPSAGVYEYLYPSGDPAGAYGSGYPPHGYAPPPPSHPLHYPLHPLHDPYYRSYTPYHHPHHPLGHPSPSSPYNSSPGPESVYNEAVYAHYHHPPPPVPFESGGTLGRYPKKAASMSSCSTPPPISLDPNAPSGSSDTPPEVPPPPLPAPQRRVLSSSASAADRYERSPAGSMGYFGTVNNGTLGRSNSSASTILNGSSRRDDAGGTPPRDPSSSNPNIPNYPPPPPPGHHPSYYGHHVPPAYYHHQHSLPEGGSPYADPYGNNPGGDHYEHFYDVPRRRKGPPEGPDHHQAHQYPPGQSSLMAFNANMEQMIMKYHHHQQQQNHFQGGGNSSLEVDTGVQSRSSPSGYGGQQYPSPASSPYNVQQQQMPKRFAYPGEGGGGHSSSSTVAANVNSSNSSSGSSSGSSGYQSTPKAPGYSSNNNLPQYMQQQQLFPLYSSGGGGYPGVEYNAQAQQLPPEVANKNQQPPASPFDDDFASWAAVPSKTEKESSPPLMGDDNNLDSNNNSPNEPAAASSLSADNKKEGDDENSRGEGGGDGSTSTGDSSGVKEVVETPPETSIFAAKADPFDDDFFK